MRNYEVNKEYMLVVNDKNHFLLVNLENERFVVFSTMQDLMENTNAKIPLETLTKIETLITDQPHDQQTNYTLPKKLQFFKNYEKRPVLTSSPNKRNLTLIEDKKKIEEYYNIITDKNNMQNKYYYNHETQRYEILNEQILGYMIEEDFDYIIEEDLSFRNACLLNTDIHTLFQIFRKIAVPDNDCINFKNLTINTRNWEVMDKKTFTTRNNNYNYLKLDDCEKNTLMERVLRMILINKKTGDEQIYWDFLQRVGASFLSQNKHKFIYLLTGSGDDGKSIILNILRLLHQKLAVTLKVKNLTDSFYLTNLSDTNVLLLDELNKHSFNHEITSILKDISGRGVIDSRIMYSQDTVQLQNYGILFIATNIVPYVPFSDTAYWNRLHIVKLSNKFVSVEDEGDLGSNEYLRDEDLEEKLAADTAGVEWLISASITAYKQCQGDFMIKQSALNTQSIYDGDDPLRLFVENYIQESGNVHDVLFTVEIKYYFLLFCFRQNVAAEDLGVGSGRELSQEIGYKVKNIFKNITKFNHRGVGYKGLVLVLDDKDSLDDLDELRESVKDFEDMFFN